MKDLDQTIEKLLAGLRDAEPPPGMHHRILDAMVAPRATAYRSRRLLHSAVAVWLACALAITIWVTHHQNITTNLRRDTTNVDAPPTKPPQTVAGVTPHEPRKSTSRALLRTTQTPGFPAPPLPLTEQEKLLLRLAHRNDAQDMNLLNPDAQAQQSAQATQQFQQFFEMNDNQMRSESE
jgi:HAMP domain-containing protein